MGFFGNSPQRFCSEFLDSIDPDFLVEMSLLKKQPDFDPRNFGFAKLGLLIRSTGKFEIDERSTDKKSIKNVYVRVKT